MTTQRNSPLIVDIAASWKRSKILAVPQFPPGEVASPPDSVKVGYIFRELLRVPPMICALVFHPSRQIDVYHCGEHILYLPGGQYSIQYIDLRQQKTAFHDICAVSSDAWDVVMNMEVIWEVSDPVRVIKSRNFTKTFRSICNAMVINFIRQNTHDQLVSTPGEKPLTTDYIGDQIKNILQTARPFEGISITNVLIHDIQGDQRRTEIIQKSIVDTTNIEQTRLVQCQKAQLASEQLAQEQHLADLQQELAIKKAKIQRLAAEEEEKVRLRKAEIAAREATLERDAKLQEIHLQQLANGQKLQHKQTIKAMEVRGEAFGQLAGAMMQGSTVAGLQRGMDPESRELIARALEALAKTIPDIPPPPTLTIRSIEEPISISLRDRLENEFDDLQSFEGLRGKKLVEIKPNVYRISLKYLNLSIHLLIDDKYPNLPPTKIMVQEDGNKASRNVDVSWKPNMDLRQIVLESVNMMVSKAHSKIIEKGDNGAQKVKPLAGD